MVLAMTKPSRRDFLGTASAATAAAIAPSFALGAQPTASTARRTRVFIGSHTPNGILAYDWDPATAELNSAGVAYDIPSVAWLAFSDGHRYMYSASELADFDGKPTGEVASFVVEDGQPHQLSGRNSAGKGTCHVAIDHTGSMVIAADYVGGSAATFLIDQGSLSGRALPLCGRQPRQGRLPPLLQRPHLRLQRLPRPRRLKRRRLKQLPR